MANEGNSFIKKAIGVAIALAVTPIVTQSVTDAAADPNLSSAAATLLGLVPLVYVAGVLTFAFIALRK